MRILVPCQWLVWIALVAPLIGCGSGGGKAPPAAAINVPGAPQDVIANVGDRAISLGWNAPASNGGATVQTYEVSAQPAVAAADIAISGRRAVLRNLTNGVGYVLSVRARSSSGAGAAATTGSLAPHVVDPGAYAAVTIQGDNSVSGVFDPSVLRLSSGTLWLSYSSVHYYNNASNQLVQDVGIRLARSTDNGATFTYEKTIASPGAAIVTDTDPARSACGTTTCSGRWVYETSWLVDDATDPDPARRYKLFAHKYFLRPGAASATFYHLGAIMMWTASSPDASWSAETSLLGWSLTPPELTPLRVVNAVHADLSQCLTVAEGGATVRNGAIDFVFACPYPGSNPLPQKIVMLRSSDHAATFQYVATLLTPADAASLGATFFTAPSIIASDNAPVLLVTPTFSGIYAGCVAIPIADSEAGTLFRFSNLPAGLLYAPAVANHLGGACSSDRGLGTRGILQNDATPGATAVSSQFRIRASGSALQVP